MNRRSLPFVLAVASTLFSIALVIACGGGTEQEQTNTAYEAPPPEPEHAPVEPAPEPTPPPAEPPPSPPEHPVINSEQAFEGLTPTPPDAWLTCTADTDCEAVEVGCCDHCNGGRVVSVVSKQAKAAQKRHRPRRCPDPCTELGCAAAQPVCQEGRCAHRAMWMVPTAAGAAAPAAAPAPAAGPTKP